MVSEDSQATASVFKAMFQHNSSIRNSLQPVIGMALHCALPLHLLLRLCAHHQLPSTGQCGHRNYVPNNCQNLFLATCIICVFSHSIGILSLEKTKRSRLKSVVISSFLLTFLFLLSYYFLV